MNWIKEASKPGSLKSEVMSYDEYMKYKDDVPYYRNISQEGVNIVA